MIPPFKTRMYIGNNLDLVLGRAEEEICLQSLLTGSVTLDIHTNNKASQVIKLHLPIVMPTPTGLSPLVT